MDRLIKIKESGKAYMYNGLNIIITDVKEVDECIKIVYSTPEVDNKVKVLKENEVDGFMDELLDIDEKSPAVAVLEIKNTSQIFNSLSQGLLSDFKKLETDSDYIGQAKQRSNIVNTMINAIKLQVGITKNNN